VADAVTAKVEELRKRLPPGVQLAIVTDAGVRVRQSVRNVEEMLVEGAILTVFVVFLFLNSWRSTVITGLALPVSVLAAFISRLGVRIHAQHDFVPARAVAGDRHSHR